MTRNKGPVSRNDQAADRPEPLVHLFFITSIRKRTPGQLECTHRALGKVKSDLQKTTSLLEIYLLEYNANSKRFQWHAYLCRWGDATVQQNALVQTHLPTNAPS